MHEKILRRAAEIVTSVTENKRKHMPYCALALMNGEGYPTITTLTPGINDGIRWVAFVTGRGSAKMTLVKECGRAAVCFHSDDYSISLSGDLEIVTDRSFIEKTWYDGLQDHFSGTDDPEYCVLALRTRAYNLLVDWTEAKGTL